MQIDAHCHTDCSDGAVSIEERIAMVKACGYDAATITDHDFVSSEQVRRAKAACGSMPYVPGIELSLQHEHQVVHLLGYFIDPENAALQNYLAQVQSVDLIYTQKLLSYFQHRGARFSMDDLISPSLHTFYSLMLVKRVARDLFSQNPQGCMPAFLTAMRSLGFIYSDLAPWSVKKAIQLIHSASGIAVLAHPGGIEDQGMRSLGFLIHDHRQIKLYVDEGLDGIEVFSPVHTAKEKQYYSSLADEYHLLATAGSDCHGDDPYLGPSWMGRFTEIPDDSFETLTGYYRSKRPSGKKHE
jgi:predicted metal-dependent phosphoesterase TrpH